MGSQAGSQGKGGVAVVEPAGELTSSADKPVGPYIGAMLRSLLRRALAGLSVIVGVVTLMFFLLRLAPGDPALLLVGPTATEEQLSAQRKALGLDRPVVEQYGVWLNQFVRGDWGTSIATGRPVRRMIGEAWPATVSLVGISLVLSYLLGIAVGGIQAARGGRLDTTLSVATVTLFAMPGYWLGLMLVMIFTYWLRILPAFGAAGFDADFLSGWDRILDRIRHLTLPLVTLTLIGIGGTARYVRGAMLDVKGAPYVTIARAKGLSPYQVTVRHVLRNALIPVLTCSDSRFRRSSPERCSSRRSSPGRGWDESW